MNTHSHHSALRNIQAFAARQPGRGIRAAQVSKVLVAGVFCVAASIQAAFAADAQPPRVSGSDIKADGKISNVKASGVAARSGGGGFNLGFSGFSLGGSGSKASGALDGAVSSGVAVINDGARVSGSDVTARGAVSNSTVSGATLRAGIVSIGSN
jgi:hypothetical protein